MRVFTQHAKGREQRDELLSAYLDDQLSAEERARLEARLATDPALQVELDALRHTVVLVRDLPPVPIPCNFILPQTMAARPRPSRPPRPRLAWAAPLLTVATAAVSLLFVVVLAGDLLLSGVGRLATAPGAEPLLEAEAPRPQALAPSPIGEEIGVEKVMPAATPLPVLTEAPPKAPPEAAAEMERYTIGTADDVESATPAANGDPVEKPAAPAPTPSQPVTEEAAAAPAAPATLEGMDATAPAMGGDGLIEETPMPTLLPSLSVAEESAAAPTAPATETAVPVADMGSAEPTPSEVDEAAPQVIEEEEPEAAEGGRGAAEGEVTGLGSALPWRALEVILGLVALGLALTTIWTWRVRRQ